MVTSATQPDSALRSPAEKPKSNERAPLSQPCSWLDSGNTDTSPGPQGWRLSQETWLEGEAGALDGWEPLLRALGARRRLLEGPSLDLWVWAGERWVRWSRRPEAGNGGPDTVLESQLGQGVGGQLLTRGDGTKWGASGGHPHAGCGPK